MVDQLLNFEGVPSLEGTEPSTRGRGQYRSLSPSTYIYVCKRLHYFVFISMEKLVDVWSEMSLTFLVASNDL